ncbi:hypothetical protein QJS10_CPB12g01423 [Acorus calamus]|uniref:Transmembrane protein n=1 Tax=Acorus calamus TaxID=4465 RepID=A0AAV9DKL6_ACOCL|nr:hypothetical protein QJS10_CPB12g01423 [Acorus calamus]
MKRRRWGKGDNEELISGGGGGFDEGEGEDGFGEGWLGLYMPNAPLVSIHCIGLLLESEITEVMRIV